MRLTALLLLVALSLPKLNHAAVVAYDDSGDAAYDDSFPQWDSGDDGGYGFTAWTLDPSPNGANSGFFTATAAQNGTGGSSGGSINAGDGDSWGLYAKSGNSAIAYRGFDFNGDSTLDSMDVDGTFTLKMDNGWNDNNVGFVLRNGNNTSGKNSGQRFEFIHMAGGNYSIVDSGGLLDTGVGWTDDGLTLAFTLTAANTYSIGITPAGSGTTTITGTLSGSGGIQSVALYNEGAGDGQNYDLFFNGMQVTDADGGGPSGSAPEPTTALLMGIGIPLLFSLRRSRQMTI